MRDVVQWGHGGQLTQCVILVPCHVHQAEPDALVDIDCQLVHYPGLEKSDVELKYTRVAEVHAHSFYQRGQEDQKEQPNYN